MYGFFGQVQIWTVTKQKPNVSDRVLCDTSLSNPAEFPLLERCKELKGANIVAVDTMDRAEQPSFTKDQLELSWEQGEK